MRDSQTMLLLVFLTNAMNEALFRSNPTERSTLVALTTGYGARYNVTKEEVDALLDMRLMDIFLKTQQESGNSQVPLTPVEQHLADAMKYLRLAREEIESGHMVEDPGIFTKLHDQVTALRDTTICAMRNQGDSLAKVSALFNLSEARISQIHTESKKAQS